MTDATRPRPPKIEAGTKMSAAEKMARIPVKIEPTTERQRKPDWIRARSPATPEVARLKKILRDNKLHTVCEERSEEHTSELQSRENLVCRLLLEKKKK